MHAGEFKWEAFSGDGQTQVLSRVDSPSGSRKCLEDPFNPEAEALETLSESLPNILALLLPPCSSRTIAALRDAAPDLKTIIVIDRVPERLELWRESFAKALPDCETLLVPHELKEAELALRERLMAFECETFLGRCAVYIPQRFRRLDKEFSEFLEGRVLYLQRESCSVAATRSMWSWRRTLNQLLNAGTRQVSRISVPEGQRPPAVVIVGAGPSLDRNIGDLKAFSDRAIIISTDAALNTMLEHQLSPDLVASIDSGPLMWRLFVKNLEKLKDVPIALSVDSNHVLLSAYPGKLALYADENSGASRLHAGLPKLKHGQCVGHFAFHLAESLSPELIVMVGFDLAYRDGKFHSAGMQCKYDADFKSSFESTASTVEGVDGAKLKTDLSLEFFLKYFEQAISACKCPVVDATEGGALKRGAKVSSLRETLEPMSESGGLFIEDNTDYDLDLSKEAVSRLHSSLVALSPQLHKIKEQALSMTPDKVRNPFKDIDLESDEFQLVSSCANFLLMAEWVKALKDYSPKDFDKFKGVMESLADDLYVCAETLATALEASSPKWTRKAGSVVALLPKEAPQNILEASLAELAPAAARFPAETPLHILWRELVQRESSAVICFDGNCAPELWSVPGLLCFDIKTSFEPTAHDKTLWLPGYTLLCEDPALLAKWRQHAPRDVKCAMLSEEAILHG